MKSSLIRVEKSLKRMKLNRFGIVYRGGVTLVEGVLHLCPPQAWRVCVSRCCLAS